MQCIKSLAVRCPVYKIESESCSPLNIPAALKSMHQLSLVSRYFVFWLAAFLCAFMLDLDCASFTVLLRATIIGFYCRAFKNQKMVYLSTHYRSSFTFPVFFFYLDNQNLALPSLNSIVRNALSLCCIS